MNRVISDEFSSGFVKASGYAVKTRRTLFARLNELGKRNIQLRELLRDRELVNNIARATGELNYVLYNILVGVLKIDKNDVVRVRINYTINLETKNITWDYGSLRIEWYKKTPDEEVNRVVREVVDRELSRILEEFTQRARRIEEEEKVLEHIVEAVKPPIEEITTPRLGLRDVIASIDILGETVDKGVLVKFTDRDGKSIGLASISPTERGVYVDAVVMYMEKARRYILESGKRLDQVLEDPSIIIEELDTVTPVELSPEEATRFIEEKMSSLV